MAAAGIPPNALTYGAAVKACLAAKAGARALRVAADAAAEGLRLEGGVMAALRAARPAEYEAMFGGGGGGRGDGGPGGAGGPSLEGGDPPRAVERPS